MLLVPNVERISSVNQLENVKEVKRNIMVYTTDPLLQNKQEFALINNSVQYGSIGAIQSKSETLYTINCYYGKVWSPCFLNPITQKMEINQDASVSITDYGYIYKHIDESGLIPDIHTTNFFSGEFNSDYCIYKNASAIGYREIMPSDPRYYNLDQQIKMTDSSNWFFVDDYPEFGPSEGTKRFYNGVNYRLGDLIDSNTTFRAILLQIDDPYMILSDETDLRNFINGILTRIINYGMLILAKEFTVILDKGNGYNALNIHRAFINMEKKYEQADVKKFYYNLQIEYQHLMDSPWNIRITIVYDEFKTYLQILPNDMYGKKMKTHFSRNDVETYIEDNYNTE